VEVLHDVLWLLLAAAVTVVLMVLGRRYDLGPWTAAVDAAVA
jgi:hypothetical protein